MTSSKSYLLMAMLIVTSIQTAYTSTPSCIDLIRQHYLSIPFDELMLANKKRRQTDVYRTSLFQRPEMQNIDWYTQDTLKLANQLDKFRKEGSHHEYHRRLNSCFKLLMQHHDVDEAQMKAVLKILSGRFKDVSKERSKEKKLLRGESAEEKQERSSQRSEEYRTRVIERKKGLGLPLKQYLKGYDLNEMSVQEIHELTLAFRDMYRSPISFKSSLYHLYRMLGYSKQQVYFQTHDERNNHCERWSRINEQEDSDHPLSGANDELDDQDAEEPGCEEAVFAMKKPAMFDTVHLDDADLYRPVYYYSPPAVGNDGYGEEGSSSAPVLSSLQQEGGVSWTFQDDDEPFLPPLDHSNQSIHDQDDVSFRDWSNFSS